MEEMVKRWSPCDLVVAEQYRNQGSRARSWQERWARNGAVLLRVGAA